MVEDVSITKLKKMEIDEVVAMGNIPPVMSILADLNIKEYLVKRILSITKDEDLEELAMLYIKTEWWKEAINFLKEQI